MIKLRALSVKLRKKWGLTQDDLLCVNCRILCGKRDVGTNLSASDINFHQADDSAEGAVSQQRIAVSDASEININDDRGTLGGLSDMDLTCDVVESAHDSEADDTEVCTQTSKLSDLSINREYQTSETLTPTQGSKLSDVSIDTLLPTINDGLARLDQSPIPWRKLGMVNWVEKKVNRVSHHLKRLLGIIENVEQNAEIDYLNLNDIIDRLKEKFHSKDTDRAQKIQILTVLPSQWSTAKISRIMDAKKSMVRTAKKISKMKGILSMPDATLGRALPESTVTVVQQFYNDDQVSTNMPGMKDYVSCRNSENQRIYVQKRLILSNLRELFEFFREENSSIAIGFSSFASLRPKYCVLAGGSGIHTVCVCPIHQNVKLMMIGANFKRLTAASSHSLNHYSDCLKLMTCNDPSPACYLGECEDCPGTPVLSDILKFAIEKEDIDSIVYKNWILLPRANLETLTKTATEFIEDFCNKMKHLSPHTFISKQQSSFLKEKRESLQDNEFLVVCDFAENYAFFVQDAAPGFHWNNDAATVYPVVIYFRNDNLIIHRSLVIISDCLSHDTVAVYTFSKIVIEFIKEINGNATKIYYFSDVAPQQFKNFKNFINLYYHAEDFEIDAEWHFFPTAHGKGPCDGIGGIVKRQAARVSLQLPPDKQITTPEQLYDWASHPTHLLHITVKYSSQCNHDETKEFLKTRFDSAQSIPATLKIHCIIHSNDSNLLVKRFSRSTEFKCHRIIKKLPKNNKVKKLRNLPQNPTMSEKCQLKRRIPRKRNNHRFEAIVTFRLTNS